MNRNWWMDPGRLPKCFCNRAVVHCLLLGSSTPEKQSFSLWLMPHSRILQDHNPQVPHLFHLLPLWISQSSLHINLTWLFLRLNVSLQRYTIISWDLPLLQFLLWIPSNLSISLITRCVPVCPGDISQTDLSPANPFSRLIYHLQTLLFWKLSWLGYYCIWPTYLQLNALPKGGLGSKNESRAFTVLHLGSWHMQSKGCIGDTWVTHYTVASCEACGWWCLSKPCFPYTVLILVIPWYLFLQNFMVLEVSPLSSLLRTLHPKCLFLPTSSYGRCNIAFLYHYLGSWLKLFIA